MTSALRRVFAFADPALPEDPTDRQATLRERRRARLAVVLDDEFDLAAEVFAIVGPLAARAETATSSRAVRAAVDDVVDAVDGLVAVSARLLAEVAAHHRTKALPFEQASAARRAILRLHRRPPAPQIGDGAVTDASWADALTAHAATVSEPLAGLLSRARPPGATGGALSASERVLEPLRDLDLAADALGRTIDRAGENVGSLDLIRATEDRDRAAAQAELAALGVELTADEQETADNDDDDGLRPHEPFDAVVR